ncbi:pirin family protein [Vallicoccus soli]|uniref:pirin family protein n=1 Tax=Vallicoccus soli TaxID=2339232 RepID=UPI001402AE0D|nr:pirin family protein [Vallicoccus soli]
MDVRRGGDRYLTRDGGVTTRHAFSFGPHYDPGNTGLGPLLVHDEHALGPRAGFAPHRHREVEVVTWVLEGEVHHEGPPGERAVLGPGTVQHLTAGTGVVHREVAGDAPARLLQAWVAPAAAGAAPAVTRSAVPLDAGVRCALRVGPHAALHLGRLRPGERAPVPSARRVHLHVARGAVLLDGVVLAAGDAARLDPPRAGAAAQGGPDGAELVVWALGPTP